MVTGDVNGDGRDDVISFVQRRAEISVWGLDGPSVESAQWKQVVHVPTGSYSGQSRVFPIVVPCNLDHDGLALKYSDAEYRLVFTEPVIMAALAAAPCGPCRGSWDRATDAFLRTRQAAVRTV